MSSKKGRSNSAARLRSQSNSTRNLVIDNKKQTIASDDERQDNKLFEKSQAFKLAHRTLDVVSGGVPSPQQKYDSLSPTSFIDTTPRNKKQTVTSFQFTSHEDDNSQRFRKITDERTDEHSSQLEGSVFLSESSD